MESVWRSNLARLRDSIVRCDACGKEVFVDTSARATRCWYCDQTVHDTLWLQLGRRRLGLSDGALVTRHHLDGSYDYDTVVGTVARHPVRTDLLGLRNDTDVTWTATVDGDEREVPPGRSIALTGGAIINYGAGPDHTVTVVAVRQN